MSFAAGNPSSLSTRFHARRAAIVLIENSTSATAPAAVAAWHKISAARPGH
jgi:hypothetical protein